MATDAPRFDVADGGGLRLADFCEQRRHLREYLRVDTECHGSDSNADEGDSDGNRVNSGPIAPFATGVVLPSADIFAVLHCAAGNFGLRVEKPPASRFLW
ncbi:hypothetical protein MGALJ_16290 [Mycobacterium gallinarum]|uniref:Uncharacterized protein n=1 Tax=Mycobacterium gallinarum TaxID=39689 RepID=A0A9W4FED7_9MYCO|nr:hypothetical protein MGALJ_16290 [Mycobacterium gallinarum]